MGTIARSVITKWDGELVDISARPRPEGAVRDGSLVITEPHEPNEGPYRRARSYRKSGGQFSPLDEALLGRLPGERVRVIHTPGELVKVRTPRGWVELRRPNSYEVEILEVKQGVPLAPTPPEAKRNSHVSTVKAGTPYTST